MFIHTDIVVRDLDLESFNDVLYVCSIGKAMRSDYIKGAESKREWFEEITKICGSVCKVAYLDDKPVAQITFYPYHLDPLYRGLNGKALVIHCIYCPFKNAQRKGISKLLVNLIVNEAKKQGYEFVIANAFDTGEFLPMPKFYEKIGFKKMRDLDDHYYLSISSKEPRMEASSYKEDSSARNKAIIFYSRVCHVFYPFSIAIRNGIKKILPNYEIELIDYWEHPELFLRKGKNWLIVNDVPIKTWFQDKEDFEKEVLEASKRKWLS